MYAEIIYTEPSALPRTRTQNRAAEDTRPSSPRITLQSALGKDIRRLLTTFVFK